MWTHTERGCQLTFNQFSSMRAKTLLLSALVCASFSANAEGWTPEHVAPNPSDVIVSADEFEYVSLDFGKEWDFTVADGAKATLVNEEAGVTLTSTSCELWAFAMQIEGKYYLRMEFEAPTANGTYVLTIPAGTMTHAGEASPQIQYTYTLNDPSLSQEEVPEIQLLSADPAAGTALPYVGLPDDLREYTFNTNINKYVAYMQASWIDVTDADAPEYIASTDANHELGSDSPLVVGRYSDSEKMYEGHTYRMEVTCYNSYQQPRKELGTFSVEYKGSSPEYVYATQKAISVDPNPDTYVITSKEDAHFTVSFDGAVTIDEEASCVSLGFGESTPYGAITPNESKTEWTFTLPERLLDTMSSFICFVQARDSEGRTVRGDENMAKYQNGDEDIAGFQFTYYSDLTEAELEVTPADGTVESLKTFTLKPIGSYTDMAPSWLAYPYLIRDRETIYTFNLTDDMDMSTPGTIVLTLPEEQTEPGRYSLIIPKGTFMCEVGQGGDENKEKMANYTIEREAQETVYDFAYTEVTPASGAVTEIKDVKFTFAEDVSVLLYDAYILDSEGKEIRKADIQTSFDDWKVATVEFEPVTEAGDYTLYIPQGTFGDEAFSMDEGGHANADYRIAYSIHSVGIDAVDGESLSGDVYNVAGVLVLRDADMQAIRSLDKGIYIVGGKKIAVK